MSGSDKSPDDIVTIPLRVSIRMQRNATGGGGALLRCTVTPDGQRQPIVEETIQGAESGLHTFTIDLELRRGDVGDYTVEVTGEETGETDPAVALANMRVVYGNNPPVIVEVTAPDTVTVQAQPVPVDLSVHVVDPSGPKDIKRVFFNSYRPDGSPSQGNPFTMYDDGNVLLHGDAVAGDGWYSLRVTLPPTTTRGEYDFEFRAIDYSNTTSNVVIHKMIVR